MATHRADTHGDDAPTAARDARLAQQARKSPAPWGWPQTIGAMIFAGVAIAFVAAMVAGSSAEDDRPDDDRAGVAVEAPSGEADPYIGFRACRELIDVRLEAAGITSQVYPDPYEDDGEVGFEVRGNKVTVESTYRVGAIEQPFTCVVRDDGDQWHLLDLDMLG